MSAPVRLALFAVVMVFAFAVSLGVGRISRGDASVPSPAPQVHDSAHGGS